MKILDKLLKRLHIKQDHWAYTERPLRRKCKTCGTIQALYCTDTDKSDYLIAWASINKTESTTTELVKAIDKALERKTMPKLSLKRQITTLLNSCSAENESNTPDYILAEYLTDCLKAYEKATKSREVWHNTKYLRNTFI